MPELGSVTPFVRELSGRARRFEVVPLIFLAVASILAVSAHMQRFPEISPFDEIVHIDYVRSLQTLEYPRLGETLDQRTFRDWACRGAYTDAVSLPSCLAAEYDPADFGGHAVQRANHPPVYYAITAVLATPFVLADNSKLVAGSRLAGAAFLFLGLAMVYYRARARGVSPLLASATLASVAIGMPTLMHASATVNNDIAVFTVGAFCLLVVDRERPFAVTMRWLLAAAVLAGSVKITALFPVVAATTVIGWQTIGTPYVGRGKKFRQLLMLSSVPVTSFITAKIWEILGTLRQLDGYRYPISGNGRPIDGNPFLGIVRSVGDTIPPTKLNYVPEALQSGSLIEVAAFLGLVVAAAVGVGLSSNDLRRQALAVAVVAGSAATGVVIQFGAALAGRETKLFPLVSTRYAMGVIPFVLLLLTHWLDDNRVTRAVAVVVVFVSLYGASTSFLV